jgi:hypothetical protein
MHRRRSTSAPGARRARTFEGAGLGRGARRHHACASHMAVRPGSWQARRVQLGAGLAARAAALEGCRVPDRAWARPRRPLRGARPPRNELRRPVCLAALRRRCGGCSVELRTPLGDCGLVVTRACTFYSGSVPLCTAWPQRQCGCSTCKALGRGLGGRLALGGASAAAWLRGPPVGCGNKSGGRGGGGLAAVIDVRAVRVRHLLHVAAGRLRRLHRCLYGGAREHSVAVAREARQAGGHLVVGVGGGNVGSW